MANDNEPIAHVEIEGNVTIDLSKGAAPAILQLYEACLLPLVLDLRQRVDRAQADAMWRTLLAVVAGGCHADLGRERCAEILAILEARARLGMPGESAGPAALH